ncbi:MAG: hypothetical protein GY903_14700 [Fuerstiella sp.]|nr:hypothetical protein [Fuerstiella sp.]MCP4855735.1 hypothetical protein [Fuerstiella sp.]
MISTNTIDTTSSSKWDKLPAAVVLVRYGVVPQVARFAAPDEVVEAIAERQLHGRRVVVDTDRGTEIGHLLELVRNAVVSDDKAMTGQVLRLSTSADEDRFVGNRRNADREFFDWQTRVQDWGLKVQLIDLEWTLDQKNLILYVLNGQNAETTRLALLAAAAGLGIVHVQPVQADGIVQQTSGGGCGGEGCGSGDCGS